MHSLCRDNDYGIWCSLQTYWRSNIWGTFLSLFYFIFELTLKKMQYFREKFSSWKDGFMDPLCAAVPKSWLIWLQCEWKMFGLFSQHAHCFVQVWTTQCHWGHLVMPWFYYGSEVTLLNLNLMLQAKAQKAMEAIWIYRSRNSDLVGTVINIHNGDWVRRGNWSKCIKSISIFMSINFYNCLEYDHSDTFCSFCNKFVQYQSNKIKFLTSF